MKKILIINVMGLHNYGGRAVIKGAIRSLSESIPDVQLTLMSSHYETEHKIYEKWDYKNVELIHHNWYKETNSSIMTLLLSGISLVYIFLKFSFYGCFHKILPLKNPYEKYDLVIDLNTDSLNDHYGIIMPIYFLINTILAIIVGKKIVITAASIGKFEKWSTKSLTKFVLNRVDLITVREEITKEYLKELYLSNQNIHLTADHAFLMEPVSSDRIKEIFSIEGIDNNKRPIIGISPSQLIYKYAFPAINNKEEKYHEYVNTLIKTIEYLVESLDSTVILIPHSFVAAGVAFTEKNDFAVSKEIFEHVKNKDRTKLITGEYDADELKGIIGTCDMFMGFRMHSTIAATSMGVPTIPVVYGHKSHGILGKMMGQKYCIIEIAKYDPDELLLEIISKIDHVWKNRFSISNELKEKTKIVEEKALLNGKLVKELFDSMSSDTI